jgi:hypothetical protein
MTVLRTLRTHLQTETGPLAFVFVAIAADCAVTAYGMLAL